MQDLREIEARITYQVGRYLRLAKSFTLIVFAAAFAGQWVGWGAILLLKWWAAMP